ncbi:MAG: biotin--[acetyl-CoA-carboxylase] ligase [Polyangiaceae bacterium]|nr:biotin--[acetyl-CoA-carboxylase] ligase [Polyangiaceae bacterium]
MVSDLDEVRVAAALGGVRLGRPLKVVAQTHSTNDDARNGAANGAPHGATFVADSQTAGRGRGGHTWHSPPGSNVYTSVVLRPNLNVAEIAPITSAVGLAVVRTVVRYVSGAMRVALKWPNDVFVNDKKIAGVLVEGQLRGDKLASLVAGIGLNVHMRDLPPDIAATATSLALAGAERLDRSEILATLLGELERAIESFERSRLHEMIEEIRERDWLRGRFIRTGETCGVADGIAEDGSLWIRDERGERRLVRSGEVLAEQQT